MRRLPLTGTSINRSSIKYLDSQPERLLHSSTHNMYTIYITHNLCINTLCELSLQTPLGNQTTSCCITLEVCGVCVCVCVWLFSQAVFTVRNGSVDVEERHSSCCRVQSEGSWEVLFVCLLLILWTSLRQKHSYFVIIRNYQNKKLRIRETVIHISLSSISGCPL